MWVWWKLKKSKHLKLPASVAAQYLLVSCPPPLLATSLLSLWNPVSRNDKLLVLQKCASGTQTGAQFPSEIFFSNTAQYFRNILAIISNSPPCLQQNRPEKDSGMGHTVCLKAVWYWEQARFMREVWSDWKSLRFDQTGKVCSLYNCRNMQTLGIHQARSASTWHLWGLLKGVRGPVIRWGFKESFRDGWLGSSLGDGAMDLK